MICFAGLAQHRFCYFSCFSGDLGVFMFLIFFGFWVFSGFLRFCVVLLFCLVACALLCVLFPCVCCAVGFKVWC